MAGTVTRMGFIKESKANAIGAEAAKAFEAGRYFFTPRLNYPATMHGLTGEIADWGIMVQAIEAAGWQMQDWCVAHDSKGRPEAYPVFRRRN